MGKALRDKCPRTSHAEWKPPHDRPDPVRLVLKADEGRLPDLLPLRHGRMVLSPFTFYRGSALAMAVDLAGTPSTGIRVQCGGDSHLVNFRGLATPERQVIFAINDLDETLPAPWEWDLKRLAASFVIACRDNGLSESVAKDAVLTCVRSYREHMAEFAEMKVLDLWYFAVEAEMLIAGVKDAGIRRGAIKNLAKARESSTSEGLFPKLVDDSGGSPIIKDQLPAIFHWKGHTAGEIHPDVRYAFARYRETLAPNHRMLLDRYEIKDAAMKVVGVGSVGTACWMMLLMAGEGDPLILQVKEARASVLEAYAGKSIFPNHGQRVVNGHRLMQPASDIFLGWTEGRLRTSLLCPPAPGRQDQVCRRDVRHGQDDPLRRVLRLLAGALPRALRRRRDDQRVPGQERRVRQGDRRVLRRLRRPERKGPRRAQTCDPRRKGQGGHRKSEVSGFCKQAVPLKIPARGILTAMTMFRQRQIWNPIL